MRDNWRAALVVLSLIFVAGVLFLTAVVVVIRRMCRVSASRGARVAAARASVNGARGGAAASAPPVSPPRFAAYGAGDLSEPLLAAAAAEEGVYVGVRVQSVQPSATEAPELAPAPAAAAAAASAAAATPAPAPMPAPHAQFFGGPALPVSAAPVPPAPGSALLSPMPQAWLAFYQVRLQRAPTPPPRTHPLAPSRRQGAFVRCVCIRGLLSASFFVTLVLSLSNVCVCVGGVVWCVQPPACLRTRQTVSRLEGSASAEAVGNALSALLLLDTEAPGQYPPEAKARLVAACSVVRQAQPHAWSDAAGRMLARALFNIDRAMAAGR